MNEDEGDQGLGQSQAQPKVQPLNYVHASGHSLFFAYFLLQIVNPGMLCNWPLHVL
jgi:hypothetical protein